MFWKPNTHDDSKRVVRRSQNRRLPIYTSKLTIQYLVETYSTLIVVGETGSGKTTQIPQYLLEAGYTRNGHQIVCTQPRRLAALSVAARVADEMRCKLGEEVGYGVRFNHQMSANTAIKFTTDGTLLRETMQDPLLSRYSVIMIDEAHERSMHTDVLLGLLRRIKMKRPKLRLIIASATLDADGFKRFFETNRSKERPDKDTAHIFHVEGRQFPVETFHLKTPVANYQTTMVKVVLDIHRIQPLGDVLCFVPGQDDVEAVVARLRDFESSKSSDQRTPMAVFPLYAGMSASDQLAALRPVRGRRKIIVATNIAETSVTIDGVVYVVDSMFVKMPFYDPKTGLDTLFVQPVSQAQALQRAGRAGRVRVGTCLRLCTAEGFASLKRTTTPEMQRSDLTWTVLQLKALGIQNVLRFKFISPPPAEALIRALELLYSLGVIDEAGELTDDIGQVIVELPLEPRTACMLLSSLEYGCSEEALTLASMLGIESLFYQSKRKATVAKVNACMQLYGVKQGDHVFMVNVYNAWVEAGRTREFCSRYAINYGVLANAADIRRHLKGYLIKFAKRHGKGQLLSCCEDVDSLLQCIVRGFFCNAAKLAPSGNYVTVKDGREIAVHPSSLLYSYGTLPQWVVFHNIQFTSKEYARHVVGINPLWLVSIAPHYYQLGGNVEGSVSVGTKRGVASMFPANAPPGSTTVVDGKKSRVLF